jgi:hypothetical protein
MPDDAQARAVSLALSYVRFRMGLDDAVAVMAWTGNGLQVRQDFTTDRDRVVSAIQQVPGGNPELFDANKQVDGLRAAVERLSPLDGKKALIYFTYPHLQHAPVPVDLRPAIDAAVGANVAFYPIDTSGPAVAAPVQRAALDPFILAAGDVLHLTVVADFRFEGAYTIRPDGLISIPLAGTIPAAGLSPKQLQSAIDTSLTPFLKEPHSQVRVTSVHRAR